MEIDSKLSNATNKNSYVWEYKKFYDKLNKVIQFLDKENYEIIIGGDFNVDLKLDRKIEQKVKKILGKNNLIAINTISNINSNIL